MTGQAGRGATIFAIGNAHIDPVWVWDWREGMREVLATFTAAADRLDGSDDVVFTASSAAYYAWVQEVDPELFERVKAHVSSGRWVVVGGEWVEPDCNFPRARPCAVNCSTASAICTRPSGPWLRSATTSTRSGTPPPYHSCTARAACRPM